MSTQIDINPGILKRENKVMSECDLIQVEELLKVADDLCFYNIIDEKDETARRPFEAIQAVIHAALKYLDDRGWTAELLSNIESIKNKQ